MNIMEFASFKSTTVNNIWDTMYNGDFLCSCPGFFYRGHCKHVDQVKIKEDEVMPLVTGVIPIDELFGGLPENMLFGIYGEPKSGKTTLMAAIAKNYIQVYQKNVLVLGSEGGEGLIYPELLGVPANVYMVAHDQLEELINSRQSKPYSLPIYEITSNAEARLHVIENIDLMSILTLVGRPITKKHSSGGKIEINAHPHWNLFSSPTKYPITRLLKDWNIGLAILDSLTMIIEPEFTNVQQSFPARHDVISKICIRLQQAIRIAQATAIISHHESKSPDGSGGRMVGGKGVHHAFKFVAAVKKIRGDEDPMRMLEVVRHHFQSPGKTTTFNINELL